MMVFLVVSFALALPMGSYLKRIFLKSVLADTGTGSVSLTTIGTAATENFDTLSDTAASTTGDTYSYGAAAATDRALGALRSGTLIPLYGAKFTNNTGATITSLDVAYTGEEWRCGTAARTDQINFQISTDATDLST